MASPDSLNYEAEYSSPYQPRYRAAVPVIGSAAAATAASLVRTVKVEDKVDSILVNIIESSSATLVSRYLSITRYGRRIPDRPSYAPWLEGFDRWWWSRPSIQRTLTTR